MTFLLRCLGVSLAFFFLFYCAFSIAVARGWKFVARAAHKFPARRMADVLFLLRVLPLAASLLICATFVIPSFLLLEPRVSSETMGEIPLALVVGCALLFVAGAYNAWLAYVRTTRTVETWLEGATEMPALGPVRIFEILPEVPSLTLTGVCSPRVLVSGSAAAVLVPEELDAALKHEIAHVRRKDNLKKLLFRVCIFPGMSALESAWSGAEEMAADDEAVTSTSEALDLAAALIKLSRLAATQPNLALTTALVQGELASVNARIERLVIWDPSRQRRSQSSVEWYVRSAFVGSLLAFLVTYGVVIREMHTLTELLVR
jgi:Zn-dependent protease with chaperone function